MSIPTHTSFRPAVRFSQCLALLAVTLTGCTRAPLQDVLGSFFPSWILCAAFGAVGAALLRALVGVLGIQQSVPAPMLTYLAFMMAITFLIWLLAFGH